MKGVVTMPQFVSCRGNGDSYVGGRRIAFAQVATAVSGSSRLQDCRNRGQQGGRPSARAYPGRTRQVKEQKTPLSLVTGEDGSFVFSGLPAGKFSLLGAKRGFNSAHYEEHIPFSTAIVTGVNIDTEHLVCASRPGAYVVGKVLDENSEPVRRANVKLYVVNHEEGASRVVGKRDGMTDDRGA